MVTLTVHGANYLALKTEGELNNRSRRVAAIGWWGLVLLTILSLVATVYVRPEITNNFSIRPWGWIIPIVVAGSLVMMKFFLAQRKEFPAFLASITYIVGMLSGAAFAMYPYLLPASTDPAYSLTIYNARTGPYSLSVGLIWWVIGIGLATVYFTFLYRSFRGKVTLEGEGY